MPANATSHALLAGPRRASCIGAVLLAMGMASSASSACAQATEPGLGPVASADPAAELAPIDEESHGATLRYLLGGYTIAVGAGLTIAGAYQLALDPLHCLLRPMCHVDLTGDYAVATAGVLLDVAGLAIVIAGIVMDAESGARRSHLTGTALGLTPNGVVVRF